MRAVHAEDSDVGVGVVKVRGDEHVVDQADAAERVFGLRHEFLPVVFGGVADVDGDQAIERGLVVGPEEEDRALVADETVLVVEFADQFHDGALGAGKTLEKHQILALGTLRDRDDQVLAVFGNMAAESPVFPVRAIIDEYVFLLWRTELVEIEFVIVVLALQLRSFFGRVITTVEEAAVVERPGRSGELAPLDSIGEILSGFDIADVPRFPVRAAFGKCIGQETAVIAEAHATDRYRSVR